MSNLDDLVKEFGAWQNKTFAPDGKYKGPGIVNHLRKEVEELSVDPRNMEELADCVFLLMHLAHQNGESLEKALRAKFQINQDRVWGKPGADGSIEHIKECEALSQPDMDQIAHFEVATGMEENIPMPGFVKYLITDTEMFDMDTIQRYKEIKAGIYAEMVHLFNEEAK